MDHHIKCGNALLGLLDADPVCRGIPQDAFTPLSGDDKALCSALKKENKAALKRIEGLDGGQGMLFDGRLWHTWFERGHRIDAMPDGTLDEVERKRSEYKAERGLRRGSTLGTAADLYAGAFLVPRAGKERRSPTSATLYALLEGMPDEPELSTRIEAARSACTEARVFHWFVEFPEVMGGERGGFDCVLGNPPWEVSQLSEEEFFASRDPNIAALAGNERKKAIAALEDKNPPLWNVYLGAKRNFESSNQFCRSTERFSLTATGKLNTYALFAETMSRILAPRGRAGLIVPTGIATDDSTKAFFSTLVLGGRLASLYDFENRNAIFPSVHRSYKFCLLTIGTAEGQGEQDEQNEQNEQKTAEFAFFLTDAGQLEERDRCFALTGRDFAAINPNTGTCPIFRSERDAALTRAVYARVPILIREARDGEPEANPWGVVLRQGLFNMTSDSHLFEPSGGPGLLPLYEAKMIHQFDHRWAGYVTEGGEPVCRDVPEERKNDPGFATAPRYWVSEREVLERLALA
ncbi:MAG: Eco57I restriction-modification methylase domain-containing protein, partial [Fretibacterium sp.]